MKLFSLILFSCALTASAQKTVVLDNYYNNETRQGKSWHYTWDDTKMSGFSSLGDAFMKQGAVLKTLREKPTEENIADADVYIIVDPDTPAEAQNPNYIDQEAARSIYNWVRKGGRLLLMTNDKKNCDLTHTNILAGMFGMHFTDKIIGIEPPAINKVRQLDDCAFTNFAKHPLTKNVRKVFLKGTSTIECKGTARGVVRSVEGDVVIAVAKCGKGSVVAVADPWLYNEYYGEHSTLPEANHFTQEKAAENLISFLLKGKKH